MSIGISFFVYCIYSEIGYYIRSDLMHNNGRSLKSVLSELFSLKCLWHCHVMPHQEIILCIESNPFDIKWLKKKDWSL